MAESGLGNNTEAAEILRKFAGGGRLTIAEQGRVELLLPVVTTVARQLTRETYLQRFSVYAAASGYEVRNIKKWVRVGRERVPQDFPPLDAPGDMPAWWSRCMKQNVPSRVLAWAGKQGAAVPAGEKPQGEVKVVSAKPPASGANKGYAALLERAEQAEVDAHDLYMQSLNAKEFNEGNMERRRRAYESAANHVRALARDKEKILAYDSEFGRWSEFEDLAGERLAVLNASMRSLPVRVATKLALPAGLFPRLVEAFGAELDRLFAALDKTGWRRVHEPGEDLALE